MYGPFCSSCRWCLIGPISSAWPANSNARTWEMAKEISKSRIPNSPVNLSGLVLFCIDTSDSESRRIFQHFSRSTRLSHLCTAPVLIFALFCTFSLTFPDFWNFLRIFQQIEHFSPQISRNFAGIAGNCRELPEPRECCRKILNF